MKGILKGIAQGVLAVILMGGPALAENLCASSEQRQIIQDFLAENSGMMPVMAARELHMPEALSPVPILLIRRLQPEVTLLSMCGPPWEVLKR